MLLMVPRDVEIVVSRSLGPHVKIINYRIDPFSKENKGILGSHYLLSVDIQDASSESKTKTHTFFVKTRPDSPIVLDFIADENMFFEESNFCGNILPKLLEDYDDERWSPRCYLANEEVIVSENLDEQGYTIPASNYLDEQLLKSALTSLARFHACSILAESRLGETFDKAYPGALVEKFFSNSNKWGKATWVTFDTIAQLAKRFNLDSSLVSEIHKKICQLVKSSETEFNVVCHNDLWKNNIMFDDSSPPKCILVDFQLLQYASPVIDVSMLLYLNTSLEFRKKFEFDMLNYYYKIFRDCLLGNSSTVKAPSYEDILSDYKKYRIVAMFYALQYLPGVYLEPEDLKKLANDPQNLTTWFHGDRYNIINENMKKDQNYEKIFSDILCEFLEEGRRLCGK